MYGWALVLLFICLGWGMGVPSWQGVGPVPRGLGACGRPAVLCTVQFCLAEGERVQLQSRCCV